VVSAPQPLSKPNRVPVVIVPEVAAPGVGAARVVVRNTAALLGGQIVLKALGFVFSVYVVRRLGDADFGRFSAVCAYVGTVAILTDLGTSGLSVREMARVEGNIASMVPDIAALRVLLSIVVSAGITAAAWWVGKPPEMVLGVFLASLVLFFYAIVGPLDSMLIAQQRLTFAAVLNVVNQAVYIAAGTVLLLAGTGYIGLLAASLLGALAMTVCGAAVVLRVWHVRFARPVPRHWPSLLRASWPFGISAATGELTRRFDTVFMSFVLTDAAVGWYNVPFNLMLMVLVVPQAFALAIYPALIKEYRSGHGSIESSVRNAMRYVLLVSLPMSVGGMLLADRIILTLYGATFAPAIAVMQMMVWALPPMFLAEILGRTTSTMHLERITARVKVLSAIIGVALIVALVPSFGLIGAAATMVITQIVDVVFYSAVIGPRLLWQPTGPFLRIALAAALMGIPLWLVRQADWVARLDRYVALAVLIALGATAYAAAALSMRAVSATELQHLSRVVALERPPSTRRS
jgi:O-antigen/teichoic acid export membrane protein